MDGQRAAAIQNGFDPDAFVGRDAEVGDLGTTVTALARGIGSTVLISGEPGIGKTRLADEIARQAAAQNCVVAWGRAWEAGGAPAFWPWTRALQGLFAALSADLAAEVLTSTHGRLDTLLGGAGAQPSAAAEAMEERFALFEAVASALRAVSSHRPVTIVLDDLHAADEPTLRLLQFVARDTRSAPVLLIGTYRDVEAPGLERTTPLLAEIARDGRHFPLLGIDEAGLRALATKRLGARPTAQFVKALTDATGGNPFFAEEILRLQRTRGVGPAKNRLDVPATVRETVRQRLAALPSSTDEVLRVAAVIGKEFDVLTIARVRDQPVEEIEEELEPALRAGLVVEQGASSTFAHGLIREVLYGDTKTTVRARLHARILEVFERLEAADQQRHLSELAHHALEAASAGADRAIDYARAAANLAMRQFAFEEAVRQYELALRAADLVTADPVIRMQLLTGLAEARAAGGDVAGACDAAVESAAVARTIGSGSGLARAALAYPSMTQMVYMPDRRLLELIREALDAVDPEDHATRAHLLAKLTWEEYFSKGPAKEVAAEALAEARASGDLVAVGAALLSQGMRHSGDGPHHPDLSGGPKDEIPGWIVECFDVAGQLGDKTLELRVCMRAIYHALENGRMHDVDSGMARHAALAEETRLPLEIYWSKVMRAMRAAYAGDFDRAPALAAEALDYGYRFAGDQTLSVFGVQNFLARVERVPLPDILAEMRSLPATFQNRIPARSGMAWLEAAAGDRGLARRELTTLCADDFALLPRDRSRFSTLALLVDLAVELDEAAICERLLPLVEPYPGRLMAAYVFAVFGTFDRARGLLLSVLGRLEEAEEALRAALALTETTGGRPLAAHIRRELAAVVSRRGAQPAARMLLEEALDAATQMGMDRLRGLVEADLALLDAPPPAPPVEAPASTADPTVTLGREGEYWTVTSASGELRFRDTKGLRYLAQLIANPGVEVHAMELVSEVGPTRAVARPDDLPSSGTTDLGPALDAKAKAQYRRRLDDLREEVEEAQSFNDPERAARAQQEHDFLLTELSRTLGLGGRDRPQGSPGEQARVNVTKAIRAAVKRIAEHDAELAAELRQCLRTGTFCSYRPIVGAATWSVAPSSKPRPV